jgi:NADPH:quinone reductase-like Zn-dependent oxidoreductase
MMKAAVLHALGVAPRYEEFAEPTPNLDEALVSVRAASRLVPATAASSGRGPGSR